MTLMFISTHFDFLTLLIILIFVHRRKDTQESLLMTQQSSEHLFQQQIQIQHCHFHGHCPMKYLLITVCLALTLVE